MTSTIPLFTGAAFDVMCGITSLWFIASGVLVGHVLGTGLLGLLCLHLGKQHVHRLKESGLYKEACAIVPYIQLIRENLELGVDKIKKYYAHMRKHQDKVIALVVIVAGVGLFSHIRKRIKERNSKIAALRAFPPREIPLRVVNQAGGKYEPLHSGIKPSKLTPRQNAMVMIGIGLLAFCTTGSLEIWNRFKGYLSLLGYVSDLFDKEIEECENFGKATCLGVKKGKGSCKSCSMAKATTLVDDHFESFETSEIAQNPKKFADILMKKIALVNEGEKITVEWFDKLSKVIKRAILAHKHITLEDFEKGAYEILYDPNNGNYYFSAGSRDRYHMRRMELDRRRSVTSSPSSAAAPSPPAQGFVPMERTTTMADRGFIPFVSGGMLSDSELRTTMIGVTSSIQPSPGLEQIRPSPPISESDWENGNLIRYRDDPRMSQADLHSIFGVQNETGFLSENGEYDEAREDEKTAERIRSGLAVSFAHGVGCPCASQDLTLEQLESHVCEYSGANVAGRRTLIDLSDYKKTAQQYVDGYNEMMTDALGPYGKYAPVAILVAAVLLIAYGFYWNKEEVTIIDEDEKEPRDILDTIEEITPESKLGDIAYRVATGVAISSATYGVLTLLGKLHKLYLKKVAPHWYDFFYTDKCVHMENCKKWPSKLGQCIDNCCEWGCCASIHRGGCKFNTANATQKEILDKLTTEEDVKDEMYQPCYHEKSCPLTSSGLYSCNTQCKCKARHNGTCTQKWSRFASESNIATTHSQMCPEKTRENCGVSNCVFRHVDDDNPNIENEGRGLLVKKRNAAQFRQKQEPTKDSEQARKAKIVNNDNDVKLLGRQRKIKFIGYDDAALLAALTKGDLRFVNAYKDGQYLGEISSISELNDLIATQGGGVKIAPSPLDGSINRFVVDAPYDYFQYLNVIAKNKPISFEDHAKITSALHKKEIVPKDDRFVTCLKNYERREGERMYRPKGQVFKPKGLAYWADQDEEDDEEFFRNVAKKQPRYKGNEEDLDLDEPQIVVPRTNVAKNQEWKQRAEKEAEELAEMTATARQYARGEKHYQSMMDDIVKAHREGKRLNIHKLAQTGKVVVKEEVLYDPHKHYATKQILKKNDVARPLQENSEDVYNIDEVPNQVIHGGIQRSMVTDVIRTPKWTERIINQSLPLEDKLIELSPSLPIETLNLYKNKVWDATKKKFTAVVELPSELKNRIANQSVLAHRPNQQIVPHLYGLFQVRYNERPIGQAFFTGQELHSVRHNFYDPTTNEMPGPLVDFSLLHPLFNVSDILNRKVENAKVDIARLFTIKQTEFIGQMIEKSKDTNGNARLVPYKFAQPKIGENVWMFSWTPDGRLKENQGVIHSEPYGGIYRHTCQTVSGDSGAPIFNTSGNIVGIHKGACEDGAYNAMIGCTGQLMLGLRSNSDDAIRKLDF